MASQSAVAYQSFLQSIQAQQNQLLAQPFGTTSKENGGQRPGGQYLAHGPQVGGSIPRQHGRPNNGEHRFADSVVPSGHGNRIPHSSAHSVSLGAGGAPSQWSQMVTVGQSARQEGSRSQADPALSSSHVSVSVGTSALPQPPRVGADARSQHVQLRTSSSTSGDDSCSSADRREAQKNAAAAAHRKTSRPKRRTPEHPGSIVAASGIPAGPALDFSSHHPEEQQQQQQRPPCAPVVAGDVGRPPLYVGPADGARHSTPPMRIPAGSASPASTAAAATSAGLRVMPPALSLGVVSAGAVMASHQWSSSSDDGGKEKDEHRLRQRVKQLNFGKVTPGYRFYRTSVPLADRQVGNPRHPLTPDATQKCSKRRWDSLVASWRRTLHLWDEDPSPADMAMDGAQTLGDRGFVQPMPYEVYMRATQEELARVASEVASMHSGAASTSSQTAGETSLDEISSNADPLTTARSNREERSSALASGGSAQQSPNTRSDSLELLSGTSPKLLINIVHKAVPRVAAQQRGAFAPSSPTAVPRGKAALGQDNRMVTMTFLRHDAQHIFATLRGHFDTSKLFFDPSTCTHYCAEFFAANAPVPKANLVALTSAERVEMFLSMCPLLPRLEYHGDSMPPICVAPPAPLKEPSDDVGRHAGAPGAAQWPPFDRQQTAAGGAPQRACAPPPSSGGRPHPMAGEELWRDVQLTPTRILFEEYSMADLTFNPKTLETAPATTFAETYGGGRVTPTRFFDGTTAAPRRTMEPSLAHLLSSSPVDEAGVAVGSAALSAGVEGSSPTKGTQARP